MIFKHNKNISRNFIAYLISIFFIISCGGGGGSSEPQANLLTFSLTGLPPSVRSYENVTIRVQPSIQGCKFEVLGPDLLWLSSSDELSLLLGHPLFTLQVKSFHLAFVQLTPMLNPNVLVHRISHLMLQEILQNSFRILSQAIFHILALYILVPMILDLGE